MNRRDMCRYADDPWHQCRRNDGSPCPPEQCFVEAAKQMRDTQDAEERMASEIPAFFDELLRRDLNLLTQAAVVFLGGSQS